METKSWALCGGKLSYCEFRLAECNALSFVAQRQERKRVSALWKKAALKWKEAIPLCPLTFVDTQQHKVKVKLEALRKLKVEAEKLEKAAEEAALVPAEQEQEITVSMTEDKDVEDVAASPSLPSLTSASVTTKRSGAISSPAPFPAVRQRVPRGSAVSITSNSRTTTKSTITDSSKASVAISRPTSAVQNPPRRVGVSTLGGPSLPSRAPGPAKAAAPVSASARPISSRSASGASTSHTTVTSHLNSSSQVAGGAVKATSVRK